MAFRQSIITLVARRGLIDGLGPCGPPVGKPPLAFALSRASGVHGKPQTQRGAQSSFVEDEPLIAMDIVQAFREAGAQSHHDDRTETGDNPR
jgi:hypothetical protein